MINQHNTKKSSLNEEWEDRWKSENMTERLTVLGKQMFKVKEKVILRFLKDITIQTVLDAGCGLGHTLKVFKKAGIDSFGVDASESAVQFCLQKGLEVEHKRIEDVTQTYDLVFSDGMLEHFLNFEPFAKKLMDLSKRYVLLIQPNHESFMGKTLVYFAELIRGHENVFEYNYRMKDYIHVFKKNGFCLIRNEGAFLNVFRFLLFEKIKK